MHTKCVVSRLRKPPPLSSWTPSKLIARWQGTNFAVYNPTARIKEKRDRDPWLVDGVTRDVLRPLPPETIVPTYLLPEKPCPPWPYKEKGYHWYHKYLDNTTKRFDENTRIIAVEGNVGSGCSDFARELAKTLGFYYIKQPKIEDILVDRYGIDKRNFYHLLPEKYCLFDEEMFFTAPDHPMVVCRAYYIFQLKVEAYANALAHLLNTGQGVVIERTAFSDNAFVRAMYEKKFVDDAYAEFYGRFRLAVFSEFQLLPHLVIYLDTPVTTCMENIKKRGRPWELNKKVLDYNYLACLEDEFKRYLKRAEKDSAVLSLDWKTPASIESIADEVYKVDFSFDYNEHDRFEEWNLLGRELAWNDVRMKFTDKLQIVGHFQGVPLKLPQMILFSDEAEHFRYIIEKIVGKYSAGYNRSRGDSIKDIMFNKRTNSLTTGHWQEYVLKDGLWSPSFDNLVYLDSHAYVPDIPEEEFQPRRFDPECLTHWKDH